MNPPRRRLFWGSGVTSIVVLLTAVALFWRDAPVQTRDLPDGSKLELHAVTYGKLHRMRLGDGLRDRLGSVLPELWARNLGCPFISAGQSNMLTVWLIWRDFRASASLRMATFDAHGCEFGVTPVSAHQRVEPREALVVGQFEVLPRRDETVGIRLYEQRMNGPWEAVGEFSVRNPDRRSFPQWQPEPLPLTKSAGAVSCTLVDMKAGVVAHSFPPRPKKPGEPAGTYLKFHLTEQGRPTTDWQILQVKEMSDAMGQVIGPRGWSGGATATGDSVLVTAGVLCWNEAAWRISLEFFRAKNFPAADVWSVSAVPLPDDDSMSSFEASTNLHGVQLRLKGIVGKNCTTPKGRRVLSGSPVVYVTRSNLRPNQHLDLIRVSQQGKDVAVRGSGGEGGDYFYAIDPPKAATDLDLIFAVSETIEFEFQVAPSHVAADQVINLER